MTEFERKLLSLNDRLLTLCKDLFEAQFNGAYLLSKRIVQLEEEMEETKKKEDEKPKKPKPKTKKKEPTPSVDEQKEEFRPAIPESDASKDARKDFDDLPDVKVKGDEFNKGDKKKDDDLPF